MPYRNPQDKRDREGWRRANFPEKVQATLHRWYVQKGLSYERNRNKKKRHAQSLMYNNLDRYPLDSECEFCGSIENLEHGHVDYGHPELYLTVCHKCNIWMDKPIEAK